MNIDIKLEYNHEKDDYGVSIDNRHIPVVILQEWAYRDPSYWSLQALAMAAIIKYPYGRMELKTLSRHIIRDVSKRLQLKRQYTAVHRG